jgi:2-phosphosulfolactate phosphatase
MAARVHLHLLPSHVEPASLAGSCVVVVDVLRASTTITHAMASGAPWVELHAEPDEARRTAAAIGRESCLLGGERGGLLIPGFDLGNSPAEYAPQVVRGRGLLFTTTNGTAAALRASQASRLCFGCFANLHAAAAWIEAGPSDQPVHVICAGTNGRVSLDDALFAGALGEALAARGITPVDEDAAGLFLAAWREARREGLASALARTRGGRGLVTLGFGADIELASRIDTHRVVGELAPPSRRLTAWNTPA